MFIEVHFDKTTGEITSVWEAGHQPCTHPSDAWKPFNVPSHPETGKPMTKEDGTLDNAALPANYGAAKIDLDYTTQIMIEQGAYDKRDNKSTWIMANMKVDLGSIKDAPPEAGYMKTARLVQPTTV